MIGRCSPDSQHGRPDCHPSNIGCSFFQYINADLRNQTNLRHKHKTWTREDNQLALHCYFRSHPSLRRCRKTMIEMRQECTSFQTTSERFADQVRTIIKEGWFSDLEILEIHQKTNNIQDSKTISDTPSTDKQEQSNQNELPISENRNTTTPNNTEQTPTQEQKINLENLKKIMNEHQTRTIYARRTQLSTKKNKKAAELDEIPPEVWKTQ